MLEIPGKSLIACKEYNILLKMVFIWRNFTSGKIPECLYYGINFLIYCKICDVNDNLNEE